MTWVIGMRPEEGYLSRVIANVPGGGGTAVRHGGVAPLG